MSKFKAGDWIEDKGGRHRCRVIGLNVYDQIVYETLGGCICVCPKGSEAGWKIIEGCDSFYWKPKPMEIWVLIKPHAGNEIFSTEEVANEVAKFHPGSSVKKFREVIE